MDNQESIGCSPPCNPPLRAPVLVLGIGNILLRDEGVGVHVVEMLREQTIPENVEVADGATGGMKLLDVICERRKLIIIDAVQCEGLPGTVIRFTIDEVPTSPSRVFSLHDVSIMDVLRAARLVGAAPNEVVFYGIKPASLDPGLDMTAEVVRALPQLVQMVLAEIGG